MKTTGAPPQQVATTAMQRPRRARGRVHQVVLGPRHGEAVAGRLLQMVQPGPPGAAIRARFSYAK